MKSIFKRSKGTMFDQKRKKKEKKPIKKEKKKLIKTRKGASVFFFPFYYFASIPPAHYRLFCLLFCLSNDMIYACYYYCRSS